MSVTVSGTGVVEASAEVEGMMLGRKARNEGVCSKHNGIGAIGPWPLEIQLDIVVGQSVQAMVGNRRAAANNCANKGSASPKVSSPTTTVTSPSPGAVARAMSPSFL